MGVAAGGAGMCAVGGAMGVVMGVAVCGRGNPPLEPQLPYCNNGLTSF